DDSCHTSYLLKLSTFLIFFFFSSRRRHTRSKRDWSSDVCSSDLRCVRARSRRKQRRDRQPQPRLKERGRIPLAGDVRLCGRRARSEERRVGKECRSWWWLYE